MAIYAFKKDLLIIYVNTFITYLYLAKTKFSGHGFSYLPSEYVVVPRGQELVSYTPTGVNGLRFRAKYGMVGLAIIQKDFVAEGLNEVGLSAGLFYFPHYVIPPQNVFFCEYLMRGTFSGQMVSSGNPLMSRVWIRHRQTKRTLKNAGEECRAPSAGWNHAISCQPYPAVQIR